MQSFIQFLENKESKKLVLLRGTPGAGKSFSLQKLKSLGAKVFSTDDYWHSEVNPENPEEYSFNPKLLGQAHDWNYQRAVKAMESGEPLIVIDNTNITAKEPKKYVQAGLKHGYKIEIKEPDSPWWKEISQLLQDKEKNREELKNWSEFLGQKNTHKVPAEVINRMFDRWHTNLTVDDIMRADDFV